MTELALALAEWAARLRPDPTGLDTAPSSWTWQNAAQLLARFLPGDGRR